MSLEAETSEMAQTAPGRTVIPFQASAPAETVTGLLGQEKADSLTMWREVPQYSRYWTVLSV